MSDSKSVKSLLFLGVTILFAPNLFWAGWSRTYGGEDWEVGRSVQQTADGGYIICGYTNSDTLHHNLLLIKTNENGDTLWTRSYGGSATDEGNCVREANDGGYIITGITGYNIWLIKTNADGDSLWTREYGIGWGYCVEQTNDKGYIITGQTGAFEELQNLLLLKTDSLGDSIWAHAYGGVNVDEGMSVNQTKDGGYVITGRTISFSNEGDDFDLWLLKTDANGDTLWTRTYGGEWQDEGCCVQETHDGGYIITGLRTVDSTGANDFLYRLWLLKTDSLGDTVWSREYGEWELRAGGRYVQEISDNGYIVTGWCYPFSYESRMDLCLLKTNSQGDTLWTRSYGGDKRDEGYCVQETNDGGYIVVGKTESFGEGYSDVWLIKTDSLGDTLSAIVEQPVTHQLNFEIAKTIGREIVLRYWDHPQGFHASVYDATGCKVDEIHSNLTRGAITWGERQSPGVYFIRSDSDVSSVTQRVILLK